jgi:hypothetical protein
MSKEKSADIDAMLADLEFDVWLAAKQGKLKDNQLIWAKALKEADPPLVISLVVRPLHPSDSTPDSPSTST